MSTNPLADLFDLMAIVGVALLLGVIAVVCTSWLRDRRAARRLGAKP